MHKKAKIWLATGITAVVVLGGGAYALTNDYLGNNVEVEGVISASNNAANSTQEASGSGKAGTFESATGAAVTGEQLNGEWTIADAAKVYFSVTTSRETVNFVDEAVSGSWTLNVDDLSQTKASGTIDMASIDSGNSQRDGHIQGPEFLDVAQFSQATLTASSFEGLPSEWTEGTAYDFNMTGTLTVRGVEKEAVFASKAVYENGQLKLSATTTVTFADFGMKNPHNVVLETENDVGVRLELVLDKA
ncbi:YceI family protein [Paenibacillus herberti]|uniref:Lipid/polyisoprenoid-binding YceI-like domain-containing protein n=1 Tax=Paenibacillus herberti TaxID=1619309 RepID=A0A229NXB9_9BACL|nr:YceI family protein [Paenibacillus herberti]OXM14269.1 hypothetical protein CGZ75_15025 [Paenibacillus herberti]